MGDSFGIVGSIQGGALGQLLFTSLQPHNDQWSGLQRSEQQLLGKRSPGEALPSGETVTHVLSSKCYPCHVTVPFAC